MRTCLKVADGGEEAHSKGLSVVHLPQQVEGSETMQGPEEEVGLLKKQ